MKIASPQAAFEFFRPRFNPEVEEFWVAALNADKTLVAAQCLFRGTVDRCLFHPRDVFRFAYLHNASSIVVAHNHPSGRIEPSDEDVRITDQLLNIAEILEVPVVDHIILGQGANYFSFISGPVLQDGR